VSIALICSAVAAAAAAVGLLRFLQLLASHPWAAAPLLVDPAADVKPDARRALQVSLWSLGLLLLPCLWVLRLLLLPLLPRCWWTQQEM
jgi:hypothetical protein